MTEGLFVKELVGEYNSYDIIDNMKSLERFKKDYGLSGTERCFYQDFYKNGVTMFMHLAFNRKAVIEYQLEYRDVIPSSTELNDLSYNKLNIKVYVMKSEYRNVKTAKYRDELKLLKMKYDIKEI